MVWERTMECHLLGKTRHGHHELTGAAGACMGPAQEGAFQQSGLEGELVRDLAPHWCVICYQ